MTGGDFIIALIIAIVIVLIYFFVFPGLYKLNTYELEGYWSDDLNRLYKLVPISNYNFNIISSDGVFNGNIFNIRSIIIYTNTNTNTNTNIHTNTNTNTNTNTGTVNYNNRFINWSNGLLWTKQSF